MQTRLGFVIPDEQPNPNALAGVLVGAGGKDVDYRLTAQVHHRPATDGGILALVDNTGRIVVRDNGEASGAGNGWSIGGPLRQNEAPVIEPTSRPVGPPTGRAHAEISLFVRVSFSEGAGRLRAFSRARDATLDEIVVENPK